MPRINAASFRLDLPAGRRGAKRYDISLSLRYAAIRRGQNPITGTGESLNISRSGLLFRSDHRLQNDDSILVALDWPVAAPDGEPLLLVLTGYVVRTKRLITAISTCTNRLLRAHQLEGHSTGFWAPVAPQPAVAEGATVLVDGDARTATVVSEVLGPQKWITRRVDAAAAKWILRDDGERVGLLVTNNAELLDSLDPEIPVILTVEGDASSLRERWSQLPRLAVVPQPLTHAVLSSLVETLCAKARSRTQAPQARG